MAGRGLGGEVLAQVFSARVLAGDHESLTLIELLAERPALGGQVLNPLRHLAAVLAASKGQFLTFGFADGALTWVGLGGLEPPTSSLSGKTWQ
jgi:hypothetical protein